MTDPDLDQVTSTRSVPTGRITLSHDYPVFRTQAAYIRAFRTLNQQRSGPGQVTAQTACTMDATAVGTLSVDPYRLGAMHIYANAPGSTVVPYWLHQLFYQVPGRFLGACDGVWRFGTISDAYSTEAVDSGYGSEEEDMPPHYAPDGMSEDEYRGLNLAEQKLVWAAAMTMTPSEFFEFLQLMRDIRAEAERFAAAQTPIGAEDGPQDAYRHAYWQCRMAQVFGVHTAKAWGDAHEKYSTRPDAARMDLLNNAVGRRIAEQGLHCGKGITGNAAALQMSLTGPPTVLTPTEPPPERPPLEG